jgi:FkbM family methyltransferase
MNIFFVCICAISSIFAYKHYPTKIREMNVPGYEPFKYVLWLHPYQGNPDGHQHYFSKQAFDSFNILPKDSVVIDIGAHTGDTSVAYARALGDSCTILAFEPCDLIYKVLKENAEYNSNIIPLNYAVTEQDGEYNFVYTDIGCCNGGLSTVLQNEGPYFGQKIPFKVKGVNLEKFLFDNYFQFIDKISFIKSTIEVAFINFSIFT